MAPAVTAPQPTLSIVIVSWNVCALLDRALASIYAAGAPADALEVIVVDNASTDGTVGHIRATYPQVHLVANPDNRGFAAANNQGIALAQGAYVLLLNSDTEVVGDALRTLVAYMAAHPEVGLVGPRLLNADGSTQSSRRGFPTLPVLFLESTWLQGLLPRAAAARYFVTGVPDTLEQAVDWVTGAAMLVRRDVVAEVGGLDESFFMYSEELDWCKRIRDAGWEIAYVPQAEIVHYGGKSSEQVVPARHIYFQASKVLYTRKVYGRGAAELLRLWLLGQYVWQIGVEGAKWLLGRRRALRVARIRAYFKVLGSRLRQPHRPATSSR